MFCPGLDPGPHRVFLSEDSWIGIDTDGFAKKGGVLMWFNEIETIHDIIAPSNVIAAD